MAERDLITLDPIWGLPPRTFVSNNMIINTMPIANITPAVPQFSLGLGLYTTRKAWTEYNKLLNYHGFKLQSDNIKVAFLAENFPTDNFQNEYGESFINKITDIASQGAGEIAQVMGQRTALGGIGASGRLLSAVGEKLGGGAGTLLQQLGGGVAKGATETRRALSELRGQRGLGAGAARTIDIINKMLAGARVDFPQVWKNSGFTPSYQLTIRLYNPKPGNKTSTQKYIIGPMVALLLLATPQTSDGDTYNWPFLQHIECPGIFNLTPSFIGSVAVIKGGDQQSISYNQRMGIMDIRLDIGSLYNSMVAGRVNLSNKSRPTLKNYAEVLALEGPHEDVYVDPEGYTPSPPVTRPITQQQAPTRSDPTTQVSPRVQQAARNTYDDLVSRARRFLGF